MTKLHETPSGRRMALWAPPLLVAIVLSLATPLFRMDVDRYVPVVPDIHYMMGGGALAVLVGLAVFLALWALVVSPSGSLAGSAALLLWLFLAFPLLQWPVVLGWDTFLHSSTTQALLQGADLGGEEYLQYPGAFYLHGSVQLVTGLGSVESSLLLSLLVGALVAFTVYVVARSGGWPALGLLAVPLFFLVNLRLADYYHYSPQKLALAGFLCLCLVLLTDMTRMKKALLILPLGIAITMSHPFTSLLTGVAFLVIALVQWAGRGRTTWRVSPQVVTVLILLFMAWHLFLASYYGDAYIRLVFTQVESGIPLSALLSPLLSRGRAVDFGWLSWYRLLILGATAALALSEMWRGRQEPRRQILSGMLLSTGVFMAILAVVSEPPVRNYLDRPLLVGSVPLAVMAAFSIGRSAGWTGEKRDWSAKPIVVAAVAMSLLVPVYFYSTQQHVYMSMMKESERGAPGFVATHLPEGRVTSDTITLLMLSYDLRAQGKERPVYGVLSRFVSDPPDFVAQAARSCVAIATYRQAVDWYYVQGVEMAEWEAAHAQVAAPVGVDLVYENGRQGVTINPGAC